MTRSIEAIWLRIGAVALIGLGALGFAFGWLGTALALLLMSGPLEAIGERLGAVRLQSARHERRLVQAREVAAAAALVALGARLTGEGTGYEPILLALATLTFSIALAGERNLLSRATPGKAE